MLFTIDAPNDWPFINSKSRIVNDFTLTNDFWKMHLASLEKICNI